MQMSNSFYTKITWVYAVAMTLLAGILLFVAQQQRSEISFLRDQVGPQSGESVPVLASVSTLDGSPLVIDYPPEELYGWVTFLTSDCIHCFTSIGALNQVVQQHPGTRVAGVAVDSIGAWKKRCLNGKLNFPLIEISQTTLAKFRINRVPSTILIDRGGNHSACCTWGP